MRAASALVAAALALLTAACATERPLDDGLPLRSLPGWTEDDVDGVLTAARAACSLPRQHCPFSVRTRAELEANYRAVPVEGEGLLTAYYAPVYPARVTPEPPFVAPVRPASDLATLGPNSPRRVIEQTTTQSALAWMRPEDLFFLQIQGSGVLVLPGGRRLRAAFAAHNGQPFIGLAKIMRERGLLADAATSGDAIRTWLAAHRGAEADALMRENPRYVFFRLEPDDGGEPRGAAGAPLPPGRAIAVDPAHHAYGGLYWISADAPALSGARLRYARLVAALDTGGAIKGPVRADLYLGRGEAAGREAGTVRHRLRMWRLVPVSR